MIRKRLKFLGMFSLLIGLFILGGFKVEAYTNLVKSSIGITKSSQYQIVINTDDLLDMVKSNLYDIELSNKEIINLFKLNPETFIKTLSLYIISEMDEATTASEQEENDLIPYTKNKIEQITNMENINEEAKHPALVKLDRIHHMNMDSELYDNFLHLQKFWLNLKK
jgi:hypothetical protein